MDLIEKAYRGGISRVLTYLPFGWFSGSLVEEMANEGCVEWKKYNLKEEFQSARMPCSTVENSEAGVGLSAEAEGAKSAVDDHVILGGAPDAGKGVTAIKVGGYTIAPYPPIPGEGGSKFNVFISNAEGEGTSVDLDSLWEKYF